MLQWYHWLTARGFDCVVLGDEFSPYPSPLRQLKKKLTVWHQWNGPGTVRNVRKAVCDMVQRAHEPQDRLVFITSSHGSGDGLGSSFLCLLPDPQVGQTQGEKRGYYMDVELASDLSHNGLNQAKNFAQGAAIMDSEPAPIFIDACFSGGTIHCFIVRSNDLFVTDQGIGGVIAKCVGNDDVHTERIRIRPLDHKMKKKVIGFR